MAFVPVLLWTDLLVFALLALSVILAVMGRGRADLVHARRRIASSAVGMSAATVLLCFFLVGLLDCLHFRVRLDAATGRAASGPASWSVEVSSVLDLVLDPLRARVEKTYSPPLGTHLSSKETMDLPDGRQVREHPRLAHGGRHLADPQADWSADVATTVLRGVGIALAAWSVVVLLVLAVLGKKERPAMRRLGHRCDGTPSSGAQRSVLDAAWDRLWSSRSGTAWPAVLWTLGVILLVAVPTALLAARYHVLGTDKVGQDVLWMVLKSVRTGLVIGTLTTLVMLPFAVFLGVAAGYFGGWVDDVIQYLYTTLHSIPGVLLIAAAVLMMQVTIENHPEWFSTATERADARLLALCLILGITSWTGLCRLVRAETLKLRELDYVTAARAFGVGSFGIIRRHLLPNLFHIVLIAVAMDFSGLVLAEAVLSYVGIGVDPGTMSFGTMINNARMELAREPVVWWSLAAAFVVMFALVLSANLFADVVRDALDPRVAPVGGKAGTRLGLGGAR